MTVFDTDVLSLVLFGNGTHRRQFYAVQAADRFVTVVNCEEVFRGRLDAIRQADTRKRLVEFITAYDELCSTIDQLGRLQVLPYSLSAHDLFTRWRAAKVRIGTQDLRIAAICVAHDATLVSRNRRDFDKVHELKLSVWN